MGSTIQEYLVSLWGKRVAVLGTDVPSTPLIKMLLRTDVEVIACDKRQREDFGGQVEGLEGLGAELRLGPGYLDGLSRDMIFRAPGLRPDVPQLLAARERGSTITSEVEVFFQVCLRKTVAVTGSDRRATTTAVIAELLKAAGQSIYMGGNIGKPLLSDVDGMVPEGVAVLELSSFQLMTMEQSPDIMVVTNLTPSRLGVHKSMEEYTVAKENVFTRQGADGLLVLGQGNEITRSFAVSTRGRVTQSSRREELGQDVFARDGATWVRNVTHKRPMLYLGGISLPGEYDVENCVAAIGALDGLVPDQVVRGFTAKFAGVEHHIELVWTRDEVRYYNDSIVSSPSRTIAGLRSFHRKVVLIVGGYDKHIPFDVLGPKVMEHIRALVLTGDTAPKLRQAAERAPGYDPTALPIMRYKDFRTAMLAICGLAQPRDVVLLSPVCAPFDRSKDSAERGVAFKRIIYSLE